MNTAKNIPSISYNLRRGDVFVGQHNHVVGKVLRVEGADGPWVLVRHRDSKKKGLEKNLPTTLFSSWRPVGEEEGERLFPWDGDRSAIDVSSVDAPVSLPRKPARRTFGGTRNKVEPITGDVSVMPRPVSRTVAHEPSQVVEDGAHFGPDPLPSTPDKTLTIKGEVVRAYLSKIDGSAWGIAIDLAAALGRNRTALRARLSRLGADLAVKVDVCSGYNNQINDTWLVRLDAIGSWAGRGIPGVDQANGAAPPRAANDTPPSQPPPAPAANDTPPAPGLAKTDADEAQRKADERVARLENVVTDLIGTVNALIQRDVQRSVAPEVAPAPLPVATKAAEHDARDQKMLNEHMGIFKDLVPAFALEELELADIRDPAQLSSTLQAKDVLAMFHAWCAKGNHSNVVCYQHAFYALLKKIHPFRNEKKKVVFTPWVRKNKRQVSLDFSGVEAGIRRDADAKEILDYARNHLWSDANDAALPLIVTLLESDRFTKDSILGGLAWLHGKFEKDGGLAGSKRRYSPQEVFLPGAMKGLVDATREKGSAK